MDWLLYDKDLRHERINLLKKSLKVKFLFLLQTPIYQDIKICT